MRHTKLFAGLMLGAGMVLAGCSHEGMDNRPPPTVPVEPYQDKPGINHEEHGPTSVPPTQMPVTPNQQ